MKKIVQTQMEIIKPTNLPRERPNSPGSALSDAFLSSIAPVQQSSSSGKGIRFDLSSVGWMTPAEIVTLACAIRSAAEKEINCRVIFPSNADSGFMWALHNYRFAHALGATSQNEPWQKRIQFENFAPLHDHAGKLKVTKQKRVFPLSWIDRKTFGYDEAPRNLYLEDPEFNQAYVRFIKGMLSRHGFVAEDAIDDFVRGVLREIGWNAVLHSTKDKSSGFAAFAGQVFEDGQELEFALADAGCGIALNLATPYRIARKSGVVPAYERQYGCSEVAAIVRHALDPGSTSRTDFPSDYDMFSDRGLALVTEIVRENGNLTLISSGAVVSIPSAESGDIRVQSLPTTLPWTCLYGSLKARPATPIKAKNEITIDFEKQIANADFYAAAVLLRRSRNDPLSLAQRILRKLTPTSKYSIVDLGFLDKKTSMVENGIAIFVRAIEPDCVTFVNVRSQRISPTRIVRAMKQAGVGLPVIIRIISDQQKVQELSFSIEDYERIDSGKLDTKQLDWKITTVAESLMCEMHFLSTSAFLKYSFGRDDQKYGFYRGRIHLLSGNVADKYFSLVAHCQADAGSAVRWNEAFGRLLDHVLQDTTLALTKVLGFAASMRPILNSLDRAHPIRDETYCLLSYDAPSKAELAEIIKSGDEVVLCTDVISTASLLHEVVDMIRRIGAKVVAVIALVDAREVSSNTWRTVFEPKTGSIPLFLAASMKRQLTAGQSFRDIDYWVDPVSAVPMSSEPESAIDVNKVLQTLKLLDSSGSVKVGHFVSGLRHTSVRIDMFKLLSERERVSEWTARELRELLKTGDWIGFRPDVALVPAGINRIDKLSTSSSSAENKPSSEIYADIVCELFQGHPQIIPVPRTFDPGGQAKCAAINNTGSSYDLSDVVIVDDGISSGGTVRSLVHQAVRVGAKRILVFALLARTRPEELDQWVLTREVFDRTLSGHALVSLIYPLHLPIPFTGKAECTQCVTLNSLRIRNSKGTSTKEGWKEIESELAPPYEYLPSMENSKYVATWLLVHSLAEIASRSAEGFEQLKLCLNNLTTDDDATQIKREAVVRLFLVEWRLLGRARLRQVIRRSVRDLVFFQLDSPRTDERRFIEALSLVRAMFPVHYINIIKRNTARIVQFEAILDRVLFHLGTLDQVEWEFERNEVLRQLVDKLASCDTTDDDRKSRQLKHLENLATDLERSSLNADIALRIRALRFALSGSTVKHNVIPTLLEITKIRPEQVEELRAGEYFSILGKQIDGFLIPTLRKEVYPLMQGLGELIGIQLEQLKLLETVQKSYFETRNGNESNCLEQDIENVRQACKIIASGINVHSSLRTALQSSNRALQQVLSQNSTLTQVLESLTCMTVNSIITSLRDSFRGYLSNSTITIEDVICEEIPGGGEARVLCPQKFVTQFASLVKQNLKNHVLDAGVPELQLRLSLSAGVMSLGHRIYVVFRVANNGPDVDLTASPKFLSRQFNKMLEHVDGCFVPAEPGGNDYAAASTLRLRIFDESEL